MTETPLTPVTDRIIDRSTLEGFAFGFFCSLCADEWRGARLAFNPGAWADPIDPAVFRILWLDQHAAAYERAKLDASFVFNRCPICGRIVCDRCFHASESGVTDICNLCYHHIKEAVV
jgi:hypothetical protein